MDTREKLEASAVYLDNAGEAELADGCRDAAEELDASAERLAEVTFSRDRYRRALKKIARSDGGAEELRKIARRAL